MKIKKMCRACFRKFKTTDSKAFFCKSCFFKNMNNPRARYKYLSNTEKRQEVIDRYKSIGCKEVS